PDHNRDRARRRIPAARRLAHAALRHARRDCVTRPFYDPVVLPRPRSLRGRLATLFALGSTGLLLATAAFVYVNVNHALLSSVDQGLHERGAEIRNDLTSGTVAIREEEA